MNQFIACFSFMVGIAFGFIVGRLYEQRRAAIAKANGDQQ